MPWFALSHTKSSDTIWQAKIAEDASPRRHAEISPVKVKDTHLMNNKLPPADILCGEWFISRLRMKNRVNIGVNISTSISVAIVAGSLQFGTCRMVFHLFNCMAIDIRVMVYFRTLALLERCIDCKCRENIKSGETWYQIFAVNFKICAHSDGGSRLISYFEWYQTWFFVLNTGAHPTAFGGRVILW